MKTIRERAKEYAPDPFDPDYILPAREGHIVNQQRIAYIAGATEQKAIDDAILLKLKSAWEREAQTNHDDEANYQQGYHDAIEQALDWFSNYLDYFNMGICDENDWLRGSPESGKERFIKAMEEYI